MIDAIRADIETASGAITADTVLQNGLFLDVFTGKLIQGDLAIREGRVMGLGDYRGREEVDLGGRVVVPGLIDAHVHIESSLLAPPAFAALTLPMGTTTLITDPHEIANVRGMAGILWLLDSSEGLPQDVFVMLPSCVPAADFEENGAVLEAEDLNTLIHHPRVLGLGEVMDYPALTSAEEGVLKKVVMARKAGKCIDGHSPQLDGPGLNAYAAAGIGTDHECSTAKEMNERLRAGMRILIREGSAARDLDALVKELDPGTVRRCAFCTDDKLPGDIFAEGHIDYNVRRAMALGLSPADAVRLATINAAETFGLEDRGALAPGRLADLVVLEGKLEDFRPLMVFKKGRLVTEKGRLIEPLPSPDHRAVQNSVNPAPLSPNDLDLKISSGRARVITLEPGSLVTGCKVWNVSVDAEGLFQADPQTDILKLAVVERHKKLGHIGLGLVSGYDLKGGAIASTISHDSHNLIALGDDDAALLAALEALIDCGGGLALTASGGEILGVLPLPLGGLMTDAPALETTEILNSLTELAHSRLNVRRDLNPFMPLSFLALPVIPEFKITTKGLFDVTAMRFVDVEHP